MTSRRQINSNQRWNNVVFVNVEVYNIKNVESTLSISTLILTTLDNVEAMLLFSTSIFTTLINVETLITLWIWSFTKSWKEQKNIFELQIKKIELNTLNSNFRLLFQNLVDFIPHFKRNMEKNICKTAKVLMTSRKCCITGTIFKPSHFVKPWPALN